MLSNTDIKKLIPNNLIEKNARRKEIFSLTIYERIRLVLEELGPAYIKLGQLLSNRDDILPEELTLELQKLQDKVSTVDIDIYDIISQELMIDPTDFFSHIDQVPIAAASLSQVYLGTLRENEERIVIKVKKKDVLSIVEADILIMKDFAKILEKYYDSAKQIGLSNILSVFEKSILLELSFVKELENIERFRRNFAGQKTIYIPKTYKNLSNANILCMEFIDGIKISERESLLSSGVDIKNVVSTVLDLYLKQIIDFGFFHADPHSGNIFVLPVTKQIAFIDYGSVGSILPQDKEYLGSFIIYVLKKDTKRLIRLIKKVAIQYNITNDIQLERELYFFIDMLDNSSIQDLDMNELVKLFNKLLNQNRIILPDYIYLLARGIVLLEGIGRELEVETNIIESVKPYTLKLIKRRLSSKYVTHKIINKLYDFSDQMQQLPEDTHLLIQKMNNNELQINHQIKGLNDIKTTINRVVLALLISSFVVGSSILINANMPPVIWGISLLGLVGFIFSALIGSILVFIILRDSK